ncbi:hypothetical protein DMA11_01905 [Marinilabiliaceae bacterium JC017]|nr:hypothetical protein DMA11_01905 [Marinilabiliaceae bacterium JC017]
MILKQLLNGDINAIGIILFLFGAIIFAFIKKLKSLFSHDKKKMLIYLLLTILCFALTGLLTIENVIGQQIMSNYIAVQVMFLAIGILHLWGMERFFEWEDDTKVAAQIAFTFICALFGSVIFLQVAGRLGVTGLQLFFCSGLLFYFFPYIYRAMFKSAMVIPIAIYQKWHYPVNKHFKVPGRDELRNPYLVSMDVEKQAFSGVTSRLRVKAPENMSFGNFFYHFLNDYNQKHPEKPIAYLDENNDPFGWIFYIKPRVAGKWSQINYEQTVARNRIRENKIILCERVKEKSGVE